MSVSTHPSQDIYNPIVPSVYVQLGAVVDVLYDGVMFIWMTWYTDDSVMTIRDDVMSLLVLHVRCDEKYCPVGTIQMVIPLTLPLLFRLLLL